MRALEQEKPSFKKKKKKKNWLIISQSQTSGKCYYVVDRSDRSRQGKRLNTRQLKKYSNVCLEGGNGTRAGMYMTELCTEQYFLKIKENTNWRCNKKT